MDSRVKLAGWTVKRGRTVQDGLRVSAGVSQSVALAVSQQEVAYALVLVLESLYTRSNMQEGIPGRPSLPSTMISAVGTLTSAAIIYTANESLAPVGFGIGFLSVAFSIYNAAKRYNNTIPDPLEWPGPRAWPLSVGVTSLLVFFILFQGLTNP